MAYYSVDWIFTELFAKFFWLPRGTEIFGPDSMYNSESFSNYIRIILESRIFDPAEPNGNNSFVTMGVTVNFYEAIENSQSKREGTK